MICEPQPSCPNMFHNPDSRVSPTLYNNKLACNIFQTVSLLKLPSPHDFILLTHPTSPSIHLQSISSCLSSTCPVLLALDLMCSYSFKAFLNFSSLFCLCLKRVIDSMEDLGILTSIQQVYVRVLLSAEKMGKFNTRQCYQAHHILAELCLCTCKHTCKDTYKQLPYCVYVSVFFKLFSLEKALSVQKDAAATCPGFVGT